MTDLRNPREDQATADEGRAPDLTSVSRRGFLGAGAAGVAVATGALAAPALLGLSKAEAFEIGPLGPEARRFAAFEIRTAVAFAEKLVPVPPHPSNDDEIIYPNKIGNYTKGLPHDPVRGEVDHAAYQKLLQALASGEQDAIDDVPLGCPDPARQRRLVDPLAGLAFTLEGTDSHQLYIPPSPSFASAEQAGEIVENYWMALLRDVPFATYATSPLAQAAAADLTRLSAFKGPKQNGVVTTQTLFRGVFPGDLSGPYVSQFRYLDAPFAATNIDQRIFPAKAGVDFVTTFDDWLAIQNGCQPDEAPIILPERRYTIDGRDETAWVHLDVNLETYIIAFFVLRNLGVPFNPGNPYLGSRTQEGFETFGYPHGASLVAEVASHAKSAMWFQKWFVHRRERPEDFAGRIDLKLTGVANYPIHPDALQSAVLPRIFAYNQALNAASGEAGSYFLPQAFPEGSPLHPSYGQGHGVVAGASVTILKAFFDGRYVLPHPVVPDPNDPTRLVPYVGPPLTVTGELNKLASNIALARDIAGVHWRSDALQALLLGETFAISVLRDQRPTFAEDFHGFTFQKFDGTTVTV